MFLKIYELDPARFHSAPRLAWQAGLKKTKAKLDLLTDIDMLIMVGKEKEQEKEQVMQLIDMQKQTTNI